MLRRIFAFRKLNSIRSRLTLWNIAALTVALVAVSVQIRVSVRANILSSIDHELASMARYAGRGAHWPWGRPGQGFPGPAPQRSLSLDVSALDNAIGVQAPRLLAPAPQPVSPPNRSPQSSPPASFRRSRRSDVVPSIPATRVFFNGPHTIMNETPWDVGAYTKAIQDGADEYTTIVSGSHNFRLITRSVRVPNGMSLVIQCSFPLSEMDRAVHSLDVSLLTMIPLVLIIAGLGGALLTNRALMPVRQITSAAEQIGAQDLSKRLPVGTDDEFANLSRTFNAMLGRLEHSFQQQRQFTADASHELKSPLTVIKANVGLALRSERTPEEYIRRLEAVDRASNHMRVLVDDLLLLARSDEGRLAANRQSISIRNLIMEVAETATCQDCASVEIEFPDQTGDFDIHIDGNRHELLRVFRNILDNAIRYTPASGSITIRVKDEGVAVCISVEDSGEGISSHHLAHLGERFYRVDSSRARSHGGSGLGLAICRSIVEAHSGTIAFQSTEGVGTTVTVTLPCQSI